MSRGPHIRSLFDLSGRVAMVTGGAQNLGLDMAEALGEAGADLVLTSRQLVKAQMAAQALTAELAVQVLPLELEVTDEASVAEGFRRVQETFGRLDVLVCNAGGARLTGGGVTTDTRLPEDWEAVMAINLKGAFLCVRAALPLMRSQGGGAIILLASLSGMVGRNRWVYEGSDMVPNMTDYSAVKGGLIAFARDLAAENGRHGIRVNALSPGGFERGQPAEFIRRYNSQTMLGRMGRDGTDLKGAVVYLASDASAYVTGQNLAVDGGFSAW